MILIQEIRKFAIENWKLLDKIGSAQREYQIQKLADKVETLILSQDSIVQITGIEPSLDDKDVINYLNEVLEYKKETEKKNYGAGSTTDSK